MKMTTGLSPLTDVEMEIAERFLNIMWGNGMDGIAVVRTLIDGKDTVTIFNITVDPFTGKPELEPLAVLVTGEMFADMTVAEVKSL